MTWLLLIHDDRARCIFACYRLADHVGVPNLHVTVVGTWWLYHLHNFKLRAWYNTLPTINCEHGVLYYRNYRSWIGFLTSLVRYSFRFFILLLTLHFDFLSVSTYLLHLCASQICSPFTICRSFLILKWKVGLEHTYLSWSNMFFYNCYL